MTSTGGKIKMVSGLVGTNDLSDWETSFVNSLLRLTDSGVSVHKMSARQLQSLELLYSKHFS